MAVARDHAGQRVLQHVRHAILRRTRHTTADTAGSAIIVGDVQLDPAAVTEPKLLQTCLEDSYRDLLDITPS